MQVLAFHLDLGDYSGRLLEFDATVAYQVIKNIGVGGGVKYFDVQLQNDFSGGGSAQFDYTFFGPTIFVYGSF